MSSNNCCSNNCGQPHCGNASGARPDEDGITNHDSARELRGAPGPDRLYVSAVQRAGVGSGAVAIGVAVRRIRGLITVVDVEPDCAAATLLKTGQITLQIDGSGERVPLSRHFGE